MSVAGVVDGAATRSNVRYGGWHPGSTRVLFPSGSVDPWRLVYFYFRMGN